METFQNKEIFLGLLIVLLIADISILLNLPLFRQFFSFLFITLIPGIIILRVLKVNNLGTANTFVFAVGLSIIFIMGFGLLLNTILPFFGYVSPLSMFSLLIFFNVIEIILIVIGYRQNSYEEIIVIVPFFNNIDKICLTIAFSLPIFSVIGLYVMNRFDENLILISLFFIIAFLVGFVVLKNNSISSSLYPILIFLISISLIFIIPLRFMHVMGVDANVEYYFFQNTFGQLHWTIVDNDLLDACLSISLLPSVYTSLSGVNAEFLFKIFGSLIFSISPIVVFLIAKKYVDQYYAFLASIFFMSQGAFTVTAALSRSNIAIFFICLTVLSLFSDNINRFNKVFLIISFFFGCLFSHYSSTYIFFIFSLITVIITYLLSMKYKVNNNLTFSMIVFFYCAIFFWYSQVIEGPFNIAVEFIARIFNFNEASYAPELASLSGQNLPNFLISPINLVIKWLTFFFIGYGVFVGARFWLMEKQKISENQFETPLANLDIEFIIIGFICGIMLLFTVILPYISVGYDIDRIFLLLNVVLSSFFVIGGIIFIKRLNLFLKRFFKKENSIALKVTSPIYLIGILVIINFFFAMSIPHQLYGEHSSMMFNSKGDLYNRMNIHDQDSFGAIWIKEFKEKNSNIYSDVYSEKVLQSQSQFQKTKRIPVLNSGHLFETGYLFTIYYNNINKKIINDWHNTTNLEPRQYEMVKDLNKVYTNKASEIWVK